MRTPMIAMLALMLSAVFALGACRNGADDDNHGHDAGHATEMHLNNGEKWKMDDHTRTSVADIKQTLEDAEAQTAEELNALGGEVQDQLRGLIDGCTMTGEAHDQLHVFLMQFQPAVGRLANSEDADKAKQALQEAEHLIEEFERHFE